MNKTLRNLALVALAAAPFSVSAEILGSGTAEDPYVIASKDDLCNAHTLTKPGETVYFIQTVDIDMAGVEVWSPLVGFNNGGYDAIINYDGKNHVIKNFAPVVPEWGVESGSRSYSGTVFGVANGQISNLGILDAKCKSNHGTGIIAAYGGHSTGDELILTNVYVTGEVDGTGKYTGGMLGCTGNSVTMENCFANVTITNTDSSPMGGLIGRANNDVTLINVYVAGTVPAAASLVAAGTGKVEVDGLVVFNTGSDVAFAAGKEVDGDVTMANTSALQGAGIKEVQSWNAYSETEMVDGYPALNYVLSGAGTEENPYIIASANDLCNAYRFVDGVNGGEFYFVQTADIDMEGVEDYSCLAGYNGAYKAILHYDGQNHLIKNFAPNDTEIGDAENSRYYYCTSIFGVPSGEIKNLGVVNAYCATEQGAGILGAYAGHSKGSALTLENVFVEGEVAGSGKYTGGMFGTTGNDLNMVNCFANVTVSGKAQTAGLVGRLGNELYLEQVYVAGTVTGDAPCLVCNTASTPLLTAINVVAFNEGASAALAAGIKLSESSEEVTVATADTKASLISDVAEWNGYTADLYKGYPMLEGFDVETSGIFDAVIDNVEANGPAVYYNLQGVRVANPENGIYIVRRGNKVAKELVK